MFLKQKVNIKNSPLVWAESKTGGDNGIKPVTVPVINSFTF